MKYELDKTDGNARRGRLVFERPQGTFTVETPAFMPVGTYGTVKGMHAGRSPCYRRRHSIK